MFGTSRPPLSEAYIAQQRQSCLWLLRQFVVFARSLALLSAGNNIAARMAMMAITTSNSIKVNAVCLRGCTTTRFWFFTMELGINAMAGETYPTSTVPSLITICATQVGWRAFLKGSVQLSDHLSPRENNKNDDESQFNLLAHKTETVPIHAVLSASSVAVPDAARF